MASRNTTPDPPQPAAWFAECDIMISMRFVLEGGKFTSVQDGYRIVKQLLDTTLDDVVEVGDVRVRWIPASWDAQSSYLTQPRYRRPAET